MDWEKTHAARDHILKGQLELSSRLVASWSSWLLSENEELVRVRTGRSPELNEEWSPHQDVQGHWHPKARHRQDPQSYFKLLHPSLSFVTQLDPSQHFLPPFPRKTSQIIGELADETGADPRRDPRIRRSGLELGVP